MFRLLRHRSIAAVVAVGTVLAVVDSPAIGVAASCTPVAVASVELLLAIAHSVASIARCLFVLRCVPWQICRRSLQTIN